MQHEADGTTSTFGFAKISFKVALEECFYLIQLGGYEE